MSLIRLVRRLDRRRDDGASAVEYGLLVALIAVVIAAVVTALGLALNAKLQKACESVNTGTTVSCTSGGSSGN